MDIRRDFQPADLIPTASVSTDDRYIRVARLFIGSDDLLPFVEILNNRELLTGNKTSTPIGIMHLSGSRLLSLRLSDLHIYVDGIWYGLNAKVLPQKQGVYLQLFLWHTPFLHYELQLLPSTSQSLVQRHENDSAHVVEYQGALQAVSEGYPN